MRCQKAQSIRWKKTRGYIIETLRCKICLIPPSTVSSLKCGAFSRLKLCPTWDTRGKLPLIKTSRVGVINFKLCGPSIRLGDWKYQCLSLQINICRLIATCSCTIFFCSTQYHRFECHSTTASYLPASVADPWNFCTDPDPNPDPSICQWP